MPVPKDKVVTKLNEKYKGRSLSKDFKNKLAEKWAEKIDTEEDIDSYINDRDDIILETISESDRRAKQASDKAKEDAARAVKGDVVEDKKEPEIPDDTPAYMKAFMKEFKSLKEELGSFKAAKSQETIYDRFKNEFAESKVPESMLKRYAPQSEEDFESAKEELTKTWGEIAPANQQQGKRFGGDIPAGGANKQVAGSTSTKPDEAVVAFAKAQNEKYINSQKN